MPRHYDGVIAALEARGLRVIPAFATGLDSRPAIDQFFIQDGVAQIDALVSLTGFSLVGGPAYNDSKAAEDVLAELDVPYLVGAPGGIPDARPMGRIASAGCCRWRAPSWSPSPNSTARPARWCSAAGPAPPASPARAAITAAPSGADPQDMHPARAGRHARRPRRPSSSRCAAASARQRKVGIVLFNFPPNAGNTGTAAYLSVFESLYRTLEAMQRAGYRVDAAARAWTNCASGSSPAMRRSSARMANVHKRIPADDHVRRERFLKEIEAQWGPAPGRQQSDGASIHVLGERFGNVFVGVQPAFGFEGDPMRLLFEKGFAPTHAFSAFYRFLREDFGAHAVLHFGTHGALEFMPGKQSGMSAACWPDRLIGDLPNIYLYASNNPSEGTIAKRRIGATLISYLTPPVANAGLYRGLIDLKSSHRELARTWPDDGGASASFSPS